MAKDFKVDQVPICVCGTNVNTHMDGADVNYLSEEARHILALGGNFVPGICNANVQKEILVSLQKMLLDYILSLYGISSQEKSLVQKMSFWSLLEFIGYNKKKYSLSEGKSVPFFIKKTAYS